MAEDGRRRRARPSRCASPRARPMVSACASRARAGRAWAAGAGDLYLDIRLEPHELYKVDGHDLYLEVPVAPWEAALGASVEIPTLDGKVSLKIPPGSRAGRSCGSRGKGLPRPQRRRIGRPLRGAADRHAVGVERGGERTLRQACAGLVLQSQGATSGSRAPEELCLLDLLCGVVHRAQRGCPRRVGAGLRAHRRGDRGAR